MGVTTWEQRKHIYEDIRELIDPGFLTCDIELGSLYISLRSLFPSDYYLLQRWSGKNTKRWTEWLIALSIWSVDGRVVIARDDSRNLLEIVKKFPRPFTDRVLASIGGMYNRCKRSSNILEAYLYEDESRRLWASTGRNQQLGLVARGIPGVLDLGRNTVQQSWVSWNELEDLKIDSDNSWARTRSIVSPHVGKDGMKRWESMEENRRRREETYRKNCLDRAYWQFTGKVLAGSSSSTFPVAQTAATEDELVEQYHRWVRGELDDHDKIVEAYKSRIRTSIEEDERDRQEAIDRANARGLEDNGSLFYVGTSVPTDSIRRVPGVRTIFEDDASERVYHRHIEKNGLAKEPQSETLNDRLSFRTPIME